MNKGKPKGKSSKSNNFKSGKNKFRSNSREKGDSFKDNPGSSYVPKENNPDWYVSDEQMKRDIARIPFAYAGGKTYTLGEISSSARETVAPVQRKYYIKTPGAMVMYMRPSLPTTVQLQDPVNQAGMKIAAYLRHTLSAKMDIEGPDIMAMEIAMASIYSYFNFCIRLYAMPSLISNLNRYTPQAIIASMGVDPISLIGNLSQFRAALNQQIRRAASLSVPANVKYFARTASMYSNIYTGGTAIQDQLYYYAPAGFWEYSEIEGAHVEYKPWIDDTQGHMYESPLKSWSQVIEYGNQLLEAVFNSEDIITISALILRAYGSSGVLTLSLLQEEALITPIFDIGILEQMANADVLGQKVMSFVDDSTKLWNVSQVVDPAEVVSGLVFNPAIQMFKTAWNDDAAEWLGYLCAGKKILNTSTAFTGEDLVLESTRLKLTANRADGGTANKPMNQTAANWFLHTATEVCTRAVMLTAVNDAGIASMSGTINMNRFCTVWDLHPLIVYKQEGDTMESPIQMGTEEFNSLGYRIKFKFAPLSILTGVRNGGSGPWPILMYDLDNYALIDPETMTTINEAATYSLFNIAVVTSAYKS